MAELFAQVSLLEALSVVFALAYLVLAIRHSPLCWAASFVSAVLAVFVFVDSRLFMQSALWAFFAGMAVYGWFQWTRRHTGASDGSLHVRTWPMRYHAGALIGVSIVSGLCAWLLTSTAQALPLLDSFVTVASVLTTWMVAHKVLENWIYWFVIDCISIYLFVSQGVMLYAGLYVVYLVLVVIGYRRWRADLRRRPRAGHPLTEPS